jgi:hypothetical protein
MENNDLEIMTAPDDLKAIIAEVDVAEKFGDEFDIYDKNLQSKVQCFKSNQISIL